MRHSLGSPRRYPLRQPWFGARPRRRRDARWSPLPSRQDRAAAWQQRCGDGEAAAYSML